MATRLLFGLLFGAALVAASVGSVQAAELTIAAVQPPNVREGTLIFIGGYFGEYTGRLGVLLSRVLKDDPRDNFSPSEPGHWLPIVDWGTNRILALVTGCPPGVYRLAIRDANPNDALRIKGSNEVHLTVHSRTERGWEPKAEPAREPGKPYLALVHPELARPGDGLDLYGDFPSPDPSLDKVILTPSPLLLAGKIPPQALRPLEISKPHVHARLPSKGLPAGEYFVRVGRHEQFRSNERRIIIRSTEPAEREYTSMLLGTTLPVSWRLVAAVQNVGVEQLCVDILGYHLGPNKAKRWVRLDSQQDLDHRKHNISKQSDSGSAVFPDHWTEKVIAWSDTRIRIQLQTGALTGVRYAVVGTYLDKPHNKVEERCANAVAVRVPAPSGPGSSK